MTSDIIKKLDLEGFLGEFITFFARSDKKIALDSLKIEGDFRDIKHKIDELSNIVFTAPSAIKVLDNELAILKKGAVLRLESIFEFVKIIRYFLYLKKLNLDNFPHIRASIEKINIPKDILEIESCFENDGNVKAGKYEKFDYLNLAIKNANKEAKKQLDRLLSNAKLSPFLVDRQVHFIDGRETLLLNAGFNSIIKGKILHRTQAGFFYILPDSLSHIYEKLDKLRNEREIALYEIECEMSAKLQENISFLKFINAEFDKFDSLQARVFFAKTKNFEFIAPNAKQNAIKLQDFCHPNLKNPIPCNIDFSAQILLITGVNAGGKTMLLKSILSASFLANFLIPFKIAPHASRIPPFSHIRAIINDPQDSKNDISTFAGRMLEFSAILGEINAHPKSAWLLGIDEIELGTDANEASALYFALLTHLGDKNIKIITTTHHKILASKMADNPRVTLLAALYDEKNRTPTYKFLQGTIGKSYAFESALRYGIPRYIVSKAQRIYDENLENLNVLLEQTSALKTSLGTKESKLNELLENSEKKNYELEQLIERQNGELEAKKRELEAFYNAELAKLKEAMKSNDNREIHRALNARHKTPKITPKTRKNFKVGDKIAQGKNVGIIVQIQGDIARIELENGVKLKSHIAHLRFAPKIAKNARSVSVQTSANPCTPRLDLHGKRAEEALELLESYISNCLMAGFSEVVIMHGIGGGVLSAVVRDFLSAHPKVREFTDAPPNLGGFGAKIVRF